MFSCDVGFTACDESPDTEGRMMMMRTLTARALIPKGLGLGRCLLPLRD